MLRWIVCGRDREVFSYELTRMYLSAKCIGCEEKCEEYYKVLQEKQECRDLAKQSKAS